MQLLIQRGQRNSYPSPVFQLWAKFELREDENALITKYKVSKSVLVEGNTWQDIKKAAMYSCALSLIGYILISISAMRMRMPLFELILAIPLLTWAIFNRIREKIIVRDILDGRNFTCNSIGILMEKEKTITDMAVMFRQFLEAMKNWDSREVIDIEPYAQPKLRVIEPPNAAE
jgi:hypothetical protein